MAVTDSIETGYAALTQGAGLVDRSERGKLALTGPQAKAFLNGQVTNDVEALVPGKGLYAALLTHKGKMLTDVRVLDAGEELLLDCERAGLQALFDDVRRARIGFDVELHKRTLQRGLLSVVGPRAREVAGDPGAEEHEHRETELGARPVRIVATDVGVDVLCLAEDDEAVAEVLRVERGRPRYGFDLDASVIPQEAGLNERAVSFTKGCYVGQETVARLFYKGKPNRHLRGLRLSAPAEPGAELRLGEKVVGAVGSAVVSPRLGPIALAIMRREAEPGATLTVGAGSAAATATVVELPF